MIGAAVALVENDDGGLVLIWGMAASCWASGDVTGRRLAAVSLVVTGSARHYEVAGGFGVNSDTLRDWRRSWEREGIEGLYLIGDAAAPRMLVDSIFDGHRLAREIDSPNPAMPLPFIRERRLWGEAANTDFDTQLFGTPDVARV